ncbi:MAG: 50S ribosomal protein L15 [Xanthomonadaceae bacterium]|nr:50S ribosomal protein L15 [Xanthomonadaceae bacterium]
MLLLNNIRKTPGATTSRKRLGRGQGSGLGHTAGKGDKGQLARSGGSVRPGFEGGQTPLHRRLPKWGFTNIYRREIAEVNLSELSKFSGSDVSLETLKKDRIVKGRFDRLYILGNGEVKKAYSIKAHKVSASAKEKIEKAGGKIELLPIPTKAPHSIRTKAKKSK